MLRRLFTILSFVSLLLCVATCVLWWRSVRLPESMRDRATWVWRGTRYAAWSDAGRVVLRAPPAAPVGMDVARQAAQLGIRNGDIVWTVSALPAQFAPGFIVTPVAYPPSDWMNRRPIFLTPATRPSAAEATPILLRALEDPDRFVAAHYGLADFNTDWDRRQDAERQADGSIRFRLDGLVVDLRDASDERSGSSEVRSADYKATVDPAQRLAIRDQWHRRLDVVAGTIPWWTVAGAAGLLPILWLSTFIHVVVRRRFRTRSTLCPACGYDLRATSGRCPECGTAAA